MDLISIGCVAAAGFLVGAHQLSRHGKREQMIYQGRCRAPAWAILKNIETAVNVPRPCATYPLSRYWLHLEKIDKTGGGVSAYLEFVERVQRKGIFATKPRAIVKKYGFIWVIQEILSANQVELIVTLFWKELSMGKKSQFEESIIQTITVLTRDLVEGLNRSSKSSTNMAFSGPPPGAPNKNSSSFAGPPPPSVSTSSAHGYSQQKNNLRSNLGGSRRSSNKMAFQALSRRGEQDPEEQKQRLIEWPTPQDYHESIQNPSSCFALKELANGMPETDRLGMPRVASGAFASVYRMQCLDRDRAVRCFLHPIKDRQFRYETLSASVGQAELRWTVNFEYLAKGICIGTNWYPILMMDWVEGIPLNSYVSTLCSARNRQGIEELRLRFQEMAAGLKEAGIAHGDLQHGNILVKSGELVLVDYDGMFVPELEGQKSHELGHPNYQHPLRKDINFDTETDNFSAWVIDTALYCLQEDPSLWSHNYDGEESLLFHRQDFLFPEESAILLHLSSHSSLNIRKRIEYFKDLLRLDVEEVPPVEFNKVFPESLNRKNSEAKLKSGHKNGLPDWLNELDNT